MPYLIKYTSSRKTWGGSVNANESFTVKQSQSFPNGQDLKKHLENSGRKVSSYSQFSGIGNLEVGKPKTRNEWTFERLK